MTKSERDSDEWFMNNLAGLVSAELLLAQKANRRVNLLDILSFIKQYRPEQLPADWLIPEFPDLGFKK